VTEEIVIVVGLLVAGYLLLALEVFVVPGVGVPGVTGALCLIVACVLAWRYFGVVGGGGLILGVLVLSTVLGALLPRTPLGRWVVLRKNLQAARVETVGVKVGDQGYAESDLRPAGIARFDDRRESVVTRGDFIQSGTYIEVVEVEGSRIVVEEEHMDVNG
jgi:membrane-bound serine protease (ClpP class)